MLDRQPFLFFRNHPIITVVLVLLIGVGGYIAYVLTRIPEPPDLNYPAGASREERVRYLLQEHIYHKGIQPVHSIMAYLENQPEGIVIHEAVGTLGRDDTPIEADYQFKTASITKVAVATVILQLVEEGEIHLDDPANMYLEDIDYLRYDDLHILDGVSYADEITIDQLLQHRTGLADIFTDTETRFIISVLTHPKRTYSVQRVFETYYRYGLNETPHFRPGEGYYYSDTNYMLLGLIIEQVSGDDLPSQLRKRIIEPLEMENTYFEYYEPATGHGRQVDTYLAFINVTRYAKTSHEWGGGGWVSTTKEMATFIQALFAGRLFEDEATLALMLDNSENAAEGKTYARGINIYELGGEQYYGHGGYYGSLLLYHPQKRVTLSVHVAQVVQPFDPEPLVVALLDSVGAG
jgi:D-alanyl-D-alanine carboxypeptidase